jgi:SsrA-binding protein
MLDYGRKSLLWLAPPSRQTCTPNLKNTVPTSKVIYSVEKKTSGLEAACSIGAVDNLRKKYYVTVAQQSEIKLLSDNRSAGHDFFLLDRYEAGLVLTGTEVKSAKSGKIQLKESYAEVTDNEAWLVNAHISEYSHGNIMNHAPVRKRKLLLHRSEIDKLRVETREKGLTLVPTRLYLKGGRIKVEIAVAKGKKFHDKREAAKAKEMQADAKAEMVRRARQ